MSPDKMSRTKCRGQNVVDKIVRTKGRGMVKMSWSRCSGQFYGQTSVNKFWVANVYTRRVASTLLTFLNRIHNSKLKLVSSKFEIEVNIVIEKKSGFIDENSLVGRNMT